MKKIMVVLLTLGLLSISSGCTAVDDDGTNEEKLQENIKKQNEEEEELKESYKFITSGTISTGNPFEENTQTYTYYYYALIDCDTPSYNDVQNIMKQLFVEQELGAVPGQAFGVYLWPSEEIANENILEDKDWSKIDYSDGEFLNQIAGVLSNHRFYNDSNYLFYYYGDNGKGSDGESWWFDGKKLEFYTFLN